MKTSHILTLLSAATLGLAACDSKQENAREKALENKADAMENKADAVRKETKNEAKAVEKQGKLEAKDIENQAKEVRDQK